MSVHKQFLHIYDGFQKHYLTIIKKTSKMLSFLLLLPTTFFPLWASNNFKYTIGNLITTSYLEQLTVCVPALTLSFVIQKMTIFTNDLYFHIQSSGVKFNIFQSTLVYCYIIVILLYPVLLEQPTPYSLLVSYWKCFAELFSLLFFLHLPKLS